MNFVERPIRRDLSNRVSDRSFVEPGQKWPIHYDSLELLAIVADLASIFLISVACGVLYHLQMFGTAGGIGKALGSAALVSVLFTSLMKILGMYKPTELLALRSQIRAAFLVWIGVFLLLSGTVFMLKIGDDLSRGASALFAIFGIIALIVDRSILSDLVARGLAGRRFSGSNVVLITDASQMGTRLAHKLAGFGFCVERFFFTPSGADALHREKLVAKVIEHVRTSDTREILLGADPNRWLELRPLVAELKVQPFPVSFIPLGTASDIFRRPCRQLGNLTCVQLQPGPLTSPEHAAKRTIDVVLAGVGLIMLLPLLTIVAFAIKLDSPGPILFRQQRCGFNGRSFQICKFRTMSVLDDGPSIVQAQRGDKRVTRVGAWLRRTSIDELPQLLNVLDGSMSLVGPRPHAIAHDGEFDKMVRNYAFRRRVKPGLTGWAQVCGSRGPTPTTASVEQRVDYDLWYIENWSLGLDFTILLRTPIEILRGHNAY
jgi:putative colanic acid biosynthesis UDP-glucose lipid carrier transferase